MNAIEDENDFHIKVLDIAPDMLELVLIPIDQHDPRVPLFGIMLMRLLEQRLYVASLPLEVVLRLKRFAKVGELFSCWSKSVQTPANKVCFFHKESLL